MCGMSLIACCKPKARKWTCTKRNSLVGRTCLFNVQCSTLMPKYATRISLLRKQIQYVYKFSIGQSLSLYLFVVHITESRLREYASMRVCVSGGAVSWLHINFQKCYSEADLYSRYRALFSSFPLFLVRF